MKELLDFARESPWWTLIYLLVIASVAQGVLGAVLGAVRKR